MTNNKGNILLYILVPLAIIFLLGLSSYAFYYASKNFSNFPKISSTPSTITQLSEPKSENDVSVTPTIATSVTIQTTVTKTTTTPAIKITTTLTPNPTLRVTPRVTVTQTPRPCDFSYDSIFGDRRCFTSSDYGELRSLEIEYEGTENLLDGAKGMEDMTCDGSEFFKSSCEDAKKDIKDLENELEDIENQAKKIISRGWKN